MWQKLHLTGGDFDGRYKIHVNLSLCIQTDFNLLTMIQPGTQSAIGDRLQPPVCEGRVSDFKQLRFEKPGLATSQAVVM